MLGGADDAAAMARFGRAQENYFRLEKGHDRIEIRTSVVSRQIAWIQEQHDWPGLAALGQVTRTRERPGEASTETAYYLVSAPCSAARFGHIVPRPGAWRIIGTGCCT